MDRVFLDANVLFSAAYDRAKPIGRLWESSDVRLITSPYAAAEALRNIARKHPDRLPELTELLSRTGLVPDASSTVVPTGIEMSAKDVPILLAAIDAKATHLLTGDHEFAPYYGKTIAGVTVLPPAEYLRQRST